MIMITKRMITKTFEVIESTYFEGVSYHIVWNCPKDANLSGNGSFFSVCAEYGSLNNLLFFDDIGGEYDTLEDALDFARKFDLDKDLERDEIRFGHD